MTRENSCLKLQGPMAAGRMRKQLEQYRTLRKQHQRQQSSICLDQKCLRCKNDFPMLRASQLNTRWGCSSLFDSIELLQACRTDCIPQRTFGRTAPKKSVRRACAKVTVAAKPISIITQPNSTKWECHKGHWHNLIAGSFSTPVAVDIKIGQYHFSGQHRMWNLQPAVHQPEKSYNAKATKKTCTRMHNDKRIAAWSYSIEKTTNNTAHWENNIKGNKVQCLPKMLTMQKWFSELRASHQYHSNLRTDCIPDFRKKKKCSHMCHGSKADKYHNTTKGLSTTSQPIELHNFEAPMQKSYIAEKSVHIARRRSTRHLFLQLTFQ